MWSGNARLSCKTLRIFHANLRFLICFIVMQQIMSFYRTELLTGIIQLRLIRICCIVIFIIFMAFSYGYNNNDVGASHEFAWGVTDDQRVRIP